MKIAIVSDYISSAKDLEFYQSQQLNLAVELSKLGLNVDVICARRNSTDGACEQVNEQIKIFRLSTVMSWSERFLKQPVMVGLWRRLKDGDYDIVQSSECHSISTFLSGFHALFRKKRLIIYQGVYRYSDNILVKFAMVFNNIVFRPVLKRACWIAVCKTTEARKYLQKHVKLSRTCVIPVGVDSSRFYADSKSESNSLELLAVGNLLPLKNYPLVIEVLHELAKIRPEVRLTIIGSGPDKEKIRRLVEKKNLSNKVCLIEQVPNNKMREFYNKASLMILLSKIEIFGMVILEAMACGCPVMASATPGASDVIKDNINGFIVSKMDPSDIAGRISRIFDDNMKLGIIRENAVRTIREKYLWPIIAKQYHNLYFEKTNG